MPNQEEEEEAPVSQQPLQHEDLDSAIPKSEKVDLSPDLIAKIQVLLVTVKEIEFLAVLRKLQPLAGQKKVLKTVPVDKDSYAVGMFGSYCAALVQTEGGAHDAQTVVENAIKCLQPKATIMIGVGYGLKPDVQKLGDVLTIGRLKTCDPERIEEGDKTVNLGVVVQGGQHLSPLFKTINTYDWEFGESTLHRGLVLTGSKQVEKEDVAKMIALKDSEALGGEWEGAGLYEACNSNGQQWILVKGIANFAGLRGEVNEDAEPYAAAAATSLVLHVLSGNSLNGLMKS